MSDDHDVMLQTPDRTGQRINWRDFYIEYVNGAELRMLVRRARSQRHAWFWCGWFLGSVTAALAALLWGRP